MVNFDEHSPDVMRGQGVGMSGIFSILSDGQSSLYRLQQARRNGGAGAGHTGTDGAGTGAGDGKQHLADLLKQGTSSGPNSGLNDYIRGASAAMTAMEQAQRINSPKAHAEERLQDAERRIRDLRAEMRMAAARGDRDKVMKLAREAAALAKQAGQAAKDYGRGIAAAAEMGIGGGAGLAGQTQVTASVSVTTVQVSQTTATLTLTVGSDEGAAAAAASMPATMPAAEPAAIPIPATPIPVDAGAAVPMPPVPAGGASAEEAAAAAKQGSDLASTINAALSALGSASGGDTGSGTVTNPFQSQVTDNALKMSRYREADTFARRVEAVLAAIKNVLGEAKVSNDTDTDQTRRKERREELKEYDKVVAEADKAVNELRSAAFGSAIPGAGTDAGGALAAAVGVPAGATTASVVNLVT